MTTRRGGIKVTNNSLTVLLVALWLLTILFLIAIHQDLEYLRNYYPVEVEPKVETTVTTDALKREHVWNYLISGNTTTITCTRMGCREVWTEHKDKDGVTWTCKPDNPILVRSLADPTGIRFFELPHVGTLEGK